MSIEDQGTIMALIDIDKDNIGYEQLTEAFAQTQEVLMRVAQYSQPIREVQRVCKHPQQIIDLQKQITDLQTKQFLHPQCDHTGLEQQLQTLRTERDEALRRPPAPGINEDLQQELEDMTQDARQSGEEVHGLRTQLANALMLAARAAPAAPHALEDRGQKFPDSPDFSGSDRTQLRGWIAQLRMVIRHKPASFPDEQSKMRISKTHFCPGGIAPSEWTRSVRAVRDTPVADYSAPGANTTRRVAYRPPIVVSPFLLALSVSYCK